MNTQDVYEYLCENCKGKENGKKRSEVAAVFGLTTRKFRRYTNEINTSPDYPAIVSTSGAIYVCGTSDDCAASIRNTYHAAITLIKKARAMEKKLGLNGQMTFEHEEVRAYLE